ncbi:kinase-like domain-containing protein, partial [Pisolithus sp. B1]
IPVLYGCSHLEHFEYMPMELLGQIVAKLWKDDARMEVKTVICFVDQVLAALQHIHSLSIVNCDIKSENFVCTLDDPLTVKLIDCDISKYFSCEWLAAQYKYDLFKGHRHIVGSLYWKNLNPHNVEGHDDIKSLASTTLFLLHGNLPWKPPPALQSPP